MTTVKVKIGIRQCFLEHLRDSREDAAVALLAFRKNKIQFFRYSLTPTLIFNMCDWVYVCFACGGHFAPNWGGMFLHIENCPTWKKLDEDASRLLYTTPEELEVAIDNALELGIL